MTCCRATARHPAPLVRQTRYVLKYTPGKQLVCVKVTDDVVVRGGRSSGGHAMGALPDAA